MIVAAHKKGARNMTSRRIAVVIVLAAGLAGCGGSGSGVSPANYRASVNKICADYNAKITALPASTENSISGLTQVEGDAAAGLHQIRALKPPSPMSAGVDKWLDSLSQSYTDASDAISALKSGNDARAKSSALAGSAQNTKNNAEARSLGLTNCAANPQPSNS
jgi:hypothetical protein